MGRISMETHTTSDRKAEDIEKLLPTHSFDLRLSGDHRLYATRLSNQRLQNEVLFGIVPAFSGWEIAGERGAEGAVADAKAQVCYPRPDLSLPQAPKPESRRQKMLHLKGAS